jgi:hypothetical protein
LEQTATNKLPGASFHPARSSDSPWIVGPLDRWELKKDTVPR